MTDDTDQDSYEPYCSRRSDNEQRWSFVRAHLADEHETLLDVGCAEGYFTRAAAEYGLDAIGVESDEARVESARREHDDVDGASFEQHTVTPDTVDDLPTTDATLLLTVQHHWVGAFGVEAATEMLRSVAAKTDRLFYEPPGSRFLTPDRPIDPDDSAQRYREYLGDVFGESIAVLDVAMFSHVNEGEWVDRRDPLFALDTTGV
ncbi:class I SAM-dependent methyltransferase [Halomicrobium salinisoli]|uniref:class I SAM-dependent methyltransferase n=1 Tax=Halomicrobium salinisoli TaxID=2878391 RepID=UPI001CF085ED|nr:methyltransferase [Halomicrobium salinisoli]